jgi:hypothetical protein
LKELRNVVRESAEVTGLISRTKVEATKKNADGSLSTTVTQHRILTTLRQQNSLPGVHNDPSQSFQLPKPPPGSVVIEPVREGTPPLP